MKPHCSRIFGGNKNQQKNVLSKGGKNAKNKMQIINVLSFKSNKNKLNKFK